MKILCIGRNYVQHARELNNPIPDEPVVFCKPDSALLRNNAPFFLPTFAKEFHHEVELVIRINRLGKRIAQRFAHRYYDEIGLGIDFTARDLQDKLRANGLPWEKCKAFDGSAVISGFTPKSNFSDINNINFRLLVNGQIKQEGNSSAMLNCFDAIVAHVSSYFTLKIGDLIFTGTPAGVGPVFRGDNLQGFIEDEKYFDFTVK